MMPHFVYRMARMHKNTPMPAKAFAHYPLGRFIARLQLNQEWGHVQYIRLQIAIKQAEVSGLIFEKKHRKVRHGCPVQDAIQPRRVIYEMLSKFFLIHQTNTLIWYFSYLLLVSRGATFQTTIPVPSLKVFGWKM